MPDPQNVGASRGGFWRKLGGGLSRALPTIEKGAARLAFAAGKKEPLLLMMEQEKMERDQKRQDLLDQVLQARESREAQSFETPEQQEARRGREAETGARLQRKYAKPTIIEETLPSGERGFAQISPEEIGTLMAEWTAPADVVPPSVFPATEARMPQGDLEAAPALPAELGAMPALPSVDFSKLIPRKPDVSLPRIVAPKEFAPPRPDQAVSAFEAWRQQNPNAPVSDWLKLEQSVKPPPADRGIPGTGRPLFDKATGRYLGDYFAEGQKFVPAPQNIPGVPSEGLTTRPLTETGERIRSDAATALVLLEDAEAATRGEHFTEVVPFAIGARSLRAAKDDIMDILRRLRTGAAINAAEEGFYRDQIPGWLDAEEDRLYKAGILRQLFTALATGQPRPDLAKFRKAGIGARGASQPPAEKNWSRSGFLAKFPNGNVAAAEEQARKNGFNIVP